MAGLLIYSQESFPFPCPEGQHANLCMYIMAKDQILAASGDPEGPSACLCMCVYVLGVTLECKGQLRRCVGLPEN